MKRFVGPTCMCFFYEYIDFDFIILIAGKPGGELEIGLVIIGLLIGATIELVVLLTPDVTGRLFRI